jgi:ubiquinone/menaquinone biosynthesis C-methylase UbiE
MDDRSKRVCPVSRTRWLDARLRKWIHNPNKIFNGFIEDDMVILDVGCGSGFFTIELAKMINGKGKVIAADLQQGMLEKVKKKIQGTEMEKKIQLHKCGKNIIGLEEKVDLVLAFYMVHEVPDQVRFLKEIRSILKPEGVLYLVEPKFHVSKKEFKMTEKNAVRLGFKSVKRPRINLSRALVLKRSSCI